MPPDTWNPALYRRFEAQRTQPARDLLARVQLDQPRFAVDLGCGPGNSTELLVERFPGTRVVGVDTSDAMLDTARQRLPGCRFEQGDIASWTPDTPPDLIYANASLQWVPDHEALVPRLLGHLAPAGVLAIQIPSNRDEPSHRLMREIASAGPWASKLATAGERLNVLPATAYYDLLTRAGAMAEVWRTIYHHPMDTPSAIVDWVRSTGLQPFLAPLDEAERAAFLQQYEAGIAANYEERADGRRLLLFPRLFLVAVKV